MPWYKQFWPWFLIAFPASAVAAGIATILIAMNDPDGLVVADYYREGLAINRDLAKQRLAHRLGLAATLTLEPATGVVRLKLHGELSPAGVHFRLIHPTRAHRDRAATLYLDRTGTWTGTLRIPTSGHWQAVAEAADDAWRLSADINIAVLDEVVLEPD